MTQKSAKKRAARARQEAHGGKYQHHLRQVGGAGGRPELCRSCSDRPADSLEHLVASAIGGRRKVPRVLCIPCNNDFGSGIDAQFAETMKPFRLLLGIVGDRDQEATMAVDDADGNSLVLGSLARSRWARRAPELLGEEANGAKRYRFANAQQAREFCEALQRKDPSRRVEVSNSTSIRRFPKPVTLPTSVGGDEFFRVVAKSALVLASLTHPARSSALASVWTFVRSGASAPHPVDRGFTSTPPPWTPTSALGPLPHLVTFAVSGGEFRADVRLFGGIVGVLRCPADPSEEPWGASYGVDPFTGVDEVDASFTGSVALPARTREEWTDATAAHQMAVRAILAEHERLSREALAKELPEQVFVDLFGSTDGVAMTPANVAQIEQTLRDTAKRVVYREDHEVPAPHLLESAKPRKPRR